jgi:hypothetical protein
VAPLRLGGLRGKKSTPSVWLGGTGELSDVGKQEQLGAGAAWRRSKESASTQGKGMGSCLGRIGCLKIYWY